MVSLYKSWVLQVTYVKDILKRIHIYKCKNNYLVTYSKTITTKKYANKLKGNTIKESKLSPSQNYCVNPAIFHENILKSVP